MKTKQPTTPEERRERIQRMKSSRTAPQALLRAMGACCPEKFAGLTAEEAWEKADGYDLSWFLRRIVPPGEDFDTLLRDLNRCELIAIVACPSGGGAMVRFYARLIRTFYQKDGTRRSSLHFVQFER